MNFFWSSWITVLSFACWIFIFAVLVFVLKSKPALEKDGTTGHNYDGIQEYDKPLPKWWLLIFFGTMFWGLAYWVLFPSVQPGAWKGITTVEVDGKQVPWTSANELNQDLQKNNATFNKNFREKILKGADADGAIPVLEKLHQLENQAHNSKDPESSAAVKTQIDEQLKALGPFIKKLSTDPAAQKIGGRLFLQNCAICHGSTAQGGTGYPNLTDKDWLHGGEPANIVTTIYGGRVGGMAAWQKQLGENGVRAAAEYVLNLSGNQHHYKLDQTLVEQGKAIFTQQCSLCHGPEGKGMTEMGAPNLTDKIWLYGGDRETIRTTVRHGRAGVMPAWQPKLGDERIMLLAAYVYSLSNNDTAAQ